VRRSFIHFSTESVLILFMHRKSAFAAMQPCHSPKHADPLSISSLPVELLSEIFLFASTDDRGGRTTVSISHVCSFWRQIAIKCLHIWATLHVSRSTISEWSRINEFRRRSKGVPFSIFVDEFLDKRHYRHCQFHKLIANSLSNTQELSVPVDIVRDLSYPAPILESLTLTRNNSSINNNITIPMDAFQGHTPCLRRVFLRDVNFSWRLPLLKNLTELSIQHASLTKDASFEFLDCLARMPFLQSLHLQHFRSAFPMGSPFRSGPSRNLVLSSVRSFTFSGDLELCSFVLENIVLQNVRKLTILLYAFLMDPKDHQSLLSKVYAFVAEHFDCLETKLEITEERDPRYTSSFYRLSCGHDSIVLEIATFDRPGHPFAFQEALHAMLPLRNVTHMEVTGDATQWPGLYGRIENTKTLLISAPIWFSMNTLDTLICGPFQQLGAYGFLPRLHTLIIRDVDFQNPLSGASEGLTFADAMRPFLESRSRAGAAIKVLHIITKERNAVVKNEDLLVLANLVDEILVNSRPRRIPVILMRS
jgi:F-box-like